jgi:hypothetical protein
MQRLELNTYCIWDFERLLETALILGFILGLSGTAVFMKRVIVFDSLTWIRCQVFDFIDSKPFL